jgi:hypothetical protein
VEPLQIDYVELHIDGPREEAMFARDTVLLGGRVEDEVAAEGRADKEERMGSSDGVAGAGDLEMATGSNHHLVDLSLSIDCGCQHLHTRGILKVLTLENDVLDRLEEYDDCPLA